MEIMYCRLMKFRPDLPDHRQMYCRLLNSWPNLLDHNQMSAFYARNITFFDIYVYIYMCIYISVYIHIYIYPLKYESFYVYQYGCVRLFVFSAFFARIAARTSSRLGMLWLRHPLLYAASVVISCIICSAPGKMLLPLWSVCCKCEAFGKMLLAFFGVQSDFQSELPTILREPCNDETENVVWYIYVSLSCENVWFAAVHWVCVCACLL